MSFLCRAGRDLFTRFAPFIKKLKISSPGRQLLHRSARIEKTSLLRGSMTVEASVILPCFLFFFINLSSSLEMIRLQANIMYAVHEAGNEICLYGSLLTEEMRTVGQTGHAGSVSDSTGPVETEEGTVSDLIIGEILSKTYVKSRIEDELGNSYLSKSPLKNGSESLNFLGSSFGDGDIVDVKLSYRVETPINIVAPSGFYMPGRFYGHLWNGYEINGDSQSLDQEKIVYITEDSEVYHVSTACTHLKLTIRPVLFSEVGDARNSGGGRYSPCEICARGEAPDTVYIGAQGDRYHYSDDCYTLTRSYTAVPLSDVEDTHRPCMRCGGG